MATIDLGKVKILWRGTWSAANTYEANDVVTLNGATWICTRGYTAVSGNRKAPGLRDRTNAYGVQLDPDKNPKDTFHVQKTLVSVPVGFKFFIDGRRNPGFTGTGNPITLVKGQTYRFQTYHSSMSGVNFRFCTTTDGTTYSNGVTVVGTPGISGSYVQITVPYDAPSSLFYKQDGTVNIADTSYFTIADVWEGFQHWELMSESFVWKGTWSSATQYYRNDVVELDGTAWIAKADSLNKQPDPVMDSVITNGGFPATRGYWAPFSEDGTRRHPGHGAFLPNHGPLDWPYKHTSIDNPVVYRHILWGTRSGRVYHSGSGTSNSQGYNPTSNANSYPMEVSFYFGNWWRSRDNLPQYTSNKSTTDTDVDNFDFRTRRTGLQQDYYGRTDNVTPHGQQPRCIQIEGNYDHYLYLFDNGEVHHAGYASQGQGGAGNATTYTGLPLRVLNFDGVRIKKISLSLIGGVADSVHHCMALDENGRVWTWGYNGQGQLGTGDTGDRYAPYCIPKEYFNHQRVVDIVAIGGSTGCSYVRTESNEIWAWGNNNAGQLGLGDTTNRWRPNRMSAFDPVANGGIIKMMATGSSSTGSFYILDGAGYLWHAGYNGYGQAATADTTNHPTITRSTIAPTAGFTTDFWALTNNGYTMVWMRTNTGATYFVGWNAGSYYTSGTGDNTSKSSPTLVFNVTNLKEVWCVWDYSNSYPRTMWLTDSGQLWAQGYVNYVWNSNTIANAVGANVEDGTNYRPYRVALPPGTKVQQLWMSSDDNSTSAYGPYVMIVTDNGQVWFAGMNQATNGWSWLGGQRYQFNISYACWTPISKGR